MPWARAVGLGLEWTWCLLGLGCLAAAAAMLKGRELPEARGRTGLALALAPMAAFALFKLTQFHAYELMWDTAVWANMVWNAAHGLWSHSSLIGDRSFFSSHFSVALLALAPVLRVWESTAPLVLLQGAATGSIPAAVYLITRQQTGDRLAPWAAAALSMAHPFFHDQAGGVLDSQTWAAPLFLWALFFWQKGRRFPALALTAWLLLTRESAPFIGLGFGAYLLTLHGHRRAGAAVVLASAAAWVGMMAVIERAQSAWPESRIDYWSFFFQDLGGSRERVLRTVFSEPWKAAAALAWPPQKLLDALRLAATCAFLPLFAGPVLLAAVAAWLPHQLADAGSGYHALTAHSSAVLYGPLLWACAAGLARLCERWRKAALAGVLAVSAGLFFAQARWALPPGMIPSAWREAGPRALAQVPRGAPVWCDEFFGAHLAMRRQVRTFPRELPSPVFETNLFVPERVLMSRHWVRLAPPEAAPRILAWLDKAGYKLVFSDADLIVLAHPGRGPAVGSPLKLP